MRRRVLHIIAIGIGLVVVAGIALYAAGLRVVLDGGGGMHLEFRRTAEERAAAIEQHRQAQRAEAARAASPLPQEDARVAPPPGATTAASPGAPTPYWTDFRGPNRDGHYREQAIRTAWPSTGLRPLYKQPVGGGYASFVIAHGRAFTIEQRGNEEVAAAYEVTSGRELWTTTWTAAFREMMGGDGPRATPTWHDGRVYVLGAQGELRCLDDATGDTVWRTNILDDAGASNLQWGMAAAPLIVDDTVVVLPGGRNGQSVVAYDRTTGDRAWSALDDGASYSSPMLVTLAGTRQILVFAATRLVGLAPDGSQVYWEFPWKTSYDVNASQPLVVGENRVFISSGYGTGAAVIEVAAAGGRFAVKEVWRNIRMKNQFTSSLLHEGFIYGLDESILACLDAATGELKWKGGRYGYGQTMLASGHIIVVTEDGGLALVEATPERHVERVRFPVLDGKTWNHPAMSDGYLLVRNLNEMATFDLNPSRR